jgi:hypothetical protein
MKELIKEYESKHLTDTMSVRCINYESIQQLIP